MPTVGKTPLMAFVLDYLRQFPGADYRRVKAAAQTFGHGIPPPVVYGNALRVIKKEAADKAEPTPADAAASPPRRGRRRLGVRQLGDLAGIVDQMQTVVADRDRLREAVDQIEAVIRSLGRRG